MLVQKNVFLLKNYLKYDLKRDLDEYRIRQSPINNRSVVAASAVSDLRPV